MITFVLASNNKGKIDEFSKICKNEIRFVLPADIGVTFDINETGKSFEHNAFIKASEVCRLSGMPSVADDSGLCVDALHGAPGIFSARYESTDQRRIARLLSELDGVPEHNRSAKFVCAIACVFPDGRSFSVVGECRGSIAFAPCGKNGFGYDPVFIVPEYGRTFAQLSPDEKNKISHRAAAISLFKSRLPNYPY